MNAQQLYEYMKEAADFLGVGFHGMDQIKVKFMEGAVQFAHGNLVVEFHTSGEQP